MKESNTIVIFLGHPAHFHLFKIVGDNLISKGFEIVFLIKRKDILEQLVRDAGYDYIVIRKQERKSSTKLGLIRSMLVMDLHVIKQLWKLRPRLYIGTYGCWTSPLYGCPTICCNEDDAAVVPRFAMLAYPMASSILAPSICNCARWDSKAIKYPSYQELAYLHPNHFTPSTSVVSGYGIDINQPYFIFRFASLKAHHDSGISGINTEIAQHLIDILAPHGTIYITSERPLEPQFEKYRIHINPLDMHHVMAFASLYIGDSQTMAAEAGVLGTPFVRFNDFVGRIGYLRELEDVYQLGYGIRASNTPILYKEDGSEQPHGKEALYETVEKLLALSAEERKKLFAARREKMLEDKIDYSKFLVWFVENYPRSAKEAKGNTDKMFWNQFK